MKKKRRDLPFILGVIDLGSHSARMEIFQIDEKGKCEVLENLSQPVPIGKDVFTNGKIEPESIILVGNILKDFSEVLSEYDVRICKAVATSAVREATNKDLFLDRIKNISGIQLEVIDAAEEVRLLYLSVRKSLESKYPLSRQDAVICMIGTGSTHIALVQGGLVKNAESFRIGTLRLYEELGQPVSGRKIRDIIDTFVGCVVDDLSKNYPPDLRPKLFVAVGAPVRALISAFIPSRKDEEITGISRSNLEKIYSIIAGMPPEKLVEKYGVSDLIAQSLEPCCDILNHFIEITSAQKLIVPMVNTRDALIDEILREIAKEEDPFVKDIVSSAKFLGERYRYDADHSQCVTESALHIFDALQAVHGIDSRGRTMLEVASILHDIGQFVNNRQHHKHSFYLIGNSQLPGISTEELDVIAAIARYHRRGGPKDSHIEYLSLSPEKRVLVCKLAGILRIADGLDRSHQHKIRNIRVTFDNARMTIHTNASFDLTLERLEVKKKSDLFREIFGLRVVIE